MQLQRSNHTVVRPFFQPSVQDDIQIGSTLHVKGSNGGIVMPCRLVFLTVRHFHPNVQCGEASTCSAKVFLGRTCHARSSISHLGRIDNYTTAEEEGTLAHSSIVDYVIWDPKYQASRFRSRIDEEVFVRPLKLQLVWPTLHCEGSLHKSWVQLDPWGISLGWGRLMEVLLQFLQTQWTGQLHHGVVSEATWSRITESTSSSSRGSRA